MGVIDGEKNELLAAGGYGQRTERCQESEKKQRNRKSHTGD